MAEADVVVVGGGTAGPVVAARLAEAGADVLVLEAGTDPDPFRDPRWPADLLDATTLGTSCGRGFHGDGIGFERASVVIEAGRATGVVVGGETIGARQAVVAAGASCSPAVLLRSGLGPAADLRALGIDVAEDLPVGENLHDQPFALLRWEGTDELARTLDATDERGRVHGVDGLVVADASLMPVVPRATTHMPTTVIGERIAASMLEDR